MHDSLTNPSAATSRENLARRLRELGINPTHQRIEIAHALMSRCEHLSADQVLALVNSRHEEVSKATVYNTLNLFLDKGLIREVIVHAGKVFYDPNTRPHHHLYNTVTGELADIDASEISLGTPIALPPGLEAEGVDIVVRVRPSA
jgi:Fur family iron response transcriptional regulator